MVSNGRSRAGGVFVFFSRRKQRVKRRRVRPLRFVFRANVRPAGFRPYENVFRTRHVFQVVHVVGGQILGAGQHVRFVQQRPEVAHVGVGDARVPTAVVAHVVYRFGGEGTTSEPRAERSGSSGPFRKVHLSKTRFRAYTG